MNIPVLNIKMCPNRSLIQGGDGAIFPSLFKEGMFGNDAKHVSERGWLGRNVTL